MIPGHCAVLPLADPPQRWAEALRATKVDPAVDTVAEVARSRFDHRRGFAHLMAVYGCPP